MIDHHAALIYTMVMVSASDREMTDRELRQIGEIIRVLPVFEDFAAPSLPTVSADCAEVLNEADGLEKALALIEAALPHKLRETAYALACDVAAADGHVQKEEVRMLEIIRHRLDIERLAAAAIERAARARFTRL
ncbi:MAG: tellurite resistance TerB family protein [Rhodospirillales bacterium]